MVIRTLLRYLKNVTKPVSVFIIPHNGMSSLRFNLPILFLLALGASWTGITIWAGYVAGQHFDYYVTKADNQVLRAKMASISTRVEEGMAYLEMTNIDRAMHYAGKALQARDAPEVRFVAGHALYAAGDFAGAL
ncbi:MAG TPA: hypothetical protein PKI19_14800, partial [Elusimicrobiales bacterium]|nr:hypothetical protein [Elusimicrobiales bacterium]